MNNAINLQQVMPKILVGTDDFQKLLLESDVFVDKTLLIKEFVENSSETVLITRPRRWGKSLNLDMIAKFLQIEVDQQGKCLPPEQRIYDKMLLVGDIELGFETKIFNPLKIATHQDIIEKSRGE